MDVRPSRTWLFRGMAFRVGILVLAASLTASVAISWISVHSIETFLRLRIDRTFPELLHTAEGRLELWYRQRQLDFDVFAGSALMRRIPSSSTEAHKETRRYLAYLLENFPQYETLLVLKPDGSPWLSVGTEVLLPEGLRREIAGRHDAGLTGLVPVGDRPLQLISAPIEGQGHPRGTLVGVLRPGAVNEPLARSDPGDAAVALLGPAGDAIAGARDVPPLRTGSDVQVVEADGHRWVAASRPFPRFGWSLVVAQDYDAAFAPVQTAVRRALFANLFVALVSSVVAFAIAAWRMTPILRLAEGARRLAAGDSDVRVSERGSLGEIQVLAHSFNEMAGRLVESRRELEARNHALLRANEILEQLSITDGLTKLHNHRHFQDQFARESKRCERSGDPLCLVLVDIDDFKKLNDRLGHSAGDRVLEAVAHLMNTQIRETDYVARYGGEEFALLLPKTDLDGALALAEKIRIEIGKLVAPVTGPDQWARVTASFGIARYEHSTSATFEAADRALYEAKANGKDCTVVATETRPRDESEEA